MHEKEMLRRIAVAESKRRGWLPGFVWGLFLGAGIAFVMLEVIGP